ncbi:hypothetical protein AJ78_04974 [Emergomyces pasteurianus Ep9510]|uniref:Uncharacterized protein n=1 Tax=Emergomyces pasteurianus Ep9510 TaxID=1447872 RepID=A0A1J9QF02_9EURO|nr:hypothetical protein AJ78_04974 [Emergomyces pasteurianus Ep9510]
MSAEKNEPRDMAAAKPGDDFVLEKASADVDVDVDEEFSYAEQRKIIHRVDRRLLIPLGLAQCIAVIDRTNTGIALIMGMREALELDVGY